MPNDNRNRPEIRDPDLKRTNQQAASRSAADDPRNRRRTRGRSRLLLILILFLIILALLYGGLSSGYLPGGDRLGLRLASPQPSQPQSDPAPTGATQLTTTGTHQIVVKENAISLDGQAISEGDLLAQVKTWSKDTTITLVDDKAIKQAYETVLSMLREHGLTFTESDA